MTAKIVLENLKHRPLRSLLSVLLIAVPVTLILSLVGISHGFIEDAKQRARAVGADVIVRFSNGSVFGSPGYMPEKMVETLRKRPHVAMAVGVQSMQVESVTMGATGVDLAQFEAMSGGLRLRSGTRFQPGCDVLVDEGYADEKNLRPGSVAIIENRPWRVCGVFEGGMLAHIIFPIGVLQDLNNRPGKVSMVYLKLDDPANAKAVADSLKNDPEWSGFGIYLMKEFTDLYSVNRVPALKGFVVVVISIGVVIGFAVMCLSMYMAVLQRTREIGILKSLGGSQAFILRIILIEALMMGLGGSVLGIVMSYGAWWLIRTLVPASIQMVIAYDWWPNATLITLAGTSLGALYPAVAAARHDAIEALAYE